MDSTATDTARRGRLRDMRPRELRKLVKRLEAALADYDTDPAVQAVIRRRRARPPEDGPTPNEHRHMGCGRDCPESGKWGAGSGMPPGHHWHWRNTAHTSGYLAHDPS
jgi:hypothetical protein